MQIRILGSCSGTEPMPNRHHTSFVLETEGGNYFFDAGEGCAYSAYLSGVKLPETRKIVISHRHMDHVGGLADLIWTLRKLDSRYHAMAGKQVEVWVPDLRLWDSVIDLVCEGVNRYPLFDLTAREITDGLLFEDRGVRVTALHTHHLAREEGQPWRAFGFLIEAEGKRVVYTGDTAGLSDYEPLLDHCDVLLHESGHHHPVEAAQKLINASRPGR